VFTGDFGRSFVFNMPVLELIFSRLPATLELTLAAVLGATLLGIPLGMYAGYKPHGMLSKLIMGLSILGFSVPTFWVGLVLIFTFAVSLGWLPAGGRGETANHGRGRLELSHPRRTEPFAAPPPSTFPSSSLPC
jgi:peptide/nickel transport system permease protein